MKKAILLSCILFSFVLTKAQNCEADTTITEPGIYPEYLDSATAGSPYQQTLQILAVKDTNVVFMGNAITATVDSIKLVEINGLPSSFSYACEPTTCVFTWENVGCAVLDGNPSSADIGEHPLEIIITSYARYLSIQLPITDTLEDFVLVVNDTGMVSVEERAIPGFWISNPSVDGKFTYQKSQQINGLRVLNINGQTVLEVKNHETTGVIDLSAHKKGLYFLEVNTPQGRRVQRLVYR